jgi:hypothetical protein
VEQSVLVAITGLVVTTIVTILFTSRQQRIALEQLQETQRMNQRTIALALEQLQEPQRMNQLTSWHESSGRLSSDRADERAMGMEAAVDYLNDVQLGRTAFRSIIDRLHYEDDPLIIHRARQGFYDASMLTPAIKELLGMNRHVWRYLLEEFRRTCLDPNESPPDEVLQVHLKKLERNQRSTSFLLQQGRSFEKLNFSDTFYPDLQAPGITFTGCDFRSSLLHFSNFHGAKFDQCQFLNCILIGSYLEAADLPGRTQHKYVDYSARYHREGDDQESLAIPPSFMWEEEQGWHGHWVEEASTTERRFSAEWPNPLYRPEIEPEKQKAQPALIEATILLEGEDGPFKREDRDRDNPNDGTYWITSRNLLDRSRRVALVGGIRTLRRGVPSVWCGIWWQELRSQQPTQIVSISPPKERERGA